MIPILVAMAMLFAQQTVAPAVPASRINGRVINSTNGDGVSKTTVLIYKPRGPSYSEITDGSGHFAIENIEPGEYLLSTDRQGFFLDMPGPVPPRIQIESGNDLIIRLVPLGVITGRLTDPEGDPLGRGIVQALQSTYVSGQKQLEGVRQVHSNERGEFRLFDLRPGAYVLQASTINPPTGLLEIRGTRVPSGFMTTYFPGATDPARATSIQVAAGAQIHGMDICLRPESVYSVRFRIPPNENSSYEPIVTINNEQSQHFGYSKRMFIDTLEFIGVPTGSYALTIVQSEGGKQSYASRNIEIVDSDVDGGMLVFLPAVDVAGTLRIEGSKLHRVQDHQVVLQSLAASKTPGKDSPIKPDGSFAIHAVPPDVYRIVMEGPDDVYLKSIRLGDRDLSDSGLDLTPGRAIEGLAIVLGSDTSEIEGSVQKSNGEPAARVRVTAIPYGNHLGRDDLYRSLFTDDKGNFLIKNVAPGDYKLFAWENAPEGAPLDPEFRKPFEEQSVKVHLPPKGHNAITLISILRE